MNPESNPYALVVGTPSELAGRDDILKKFALQLGVTSWGNLCVVLRFWGARGWRDCPTK